jgi:protein-S-isoprenylcysteine O-methyltransferase Ste14
MCSCECCLANFVTGYVDVPVDLSKLANFLKWKVTTLACFGTMAITWLYTRLYILPVKIYWTTITKSHYLLESGTAPVLLYVCFRHFFYLFLGLLILLHAVWFTMFLHMFHTFIVKRDIHDYSEHKNGEAPSTISQPAEKKSV